MCPSNVCFCLAHSEEDGREGCGGDPGRRPEGEGRARWGCKRLILPAGPEPHPMIHPQTKVGPISPARLCNAPFPAPMPGRERFG